MITVDDCKTQKLYADSILEILEKWRSDNSIEKTESDYQTATALFTQMTNLSKGMALVEKILSDKPKPDSHADDLDDLF